MVGLNSFVAFAGHQISVVLDTANGKRAGRVGIRLDIKVTTKADTDQTGQSCN